MWLAVVGKLSEGGILLGRIVWGMPSGEFYGTKCPQVFWGQRFYRRGIFHRGMFRGISRGTVPRGVSFSGSIVVKI